MYNKYIAIITAENKEKYLSRTINSCLKNLQNNNLKIIIIYKFLSNESILKFKFKNFKNIIFYKINIKKNYPTQDQLYKIEHALKFIKNEWVLLLDGDDIFKKNKINTLKYLKLDKKKIYLHDHEIKQNNQIKKSIFKNYKNFFLYKLLFNDWPQKINTSSIVIYGDLLKRFYKNHKPYLWKYLAIDIQIVLYFFYKKKFKTINKILTTKIENINNLDKNFSNFRHKIYWCRRLEQHKLTRNLSGRINLIDKIITLFFLKIFK